MKGREVATDLATEKLELRSEAVSSASLSKPYRQLKKISVESTQLNIECAMLLGRLIHANHDLEELNLAYCNLGAKGAVIIINGLIASSANLRRLNLTCSYIGVLGARSLAGVITNPECKLEFLSVAGNHNLELGIKIISEAVRQNNSIRELDCTGLFSSDDENVNAIARMISGNKTVEKLKLTTDDCSEEQCATIVTALADNSAIRWLTLHKNTRYTFGSSIKALAAALMHNKTLETLHLDSWQEIGDEAIDLAEALKANNRLSKLNMANISVNDKSLAALLEGINSGGHLKYLSIKIQNNDKTAAQALAAFLSDPRCSLRQLHIYCDSFREADYIAIFTALRSNRSVVTFSWFRYTYEYASEAAELTLLQTLQAYNCTLQFVTDKSSSSRYSADIQQCLERNKTLTSYFLGLDEFKAITDEMKKARAKLSVAMQPYSLRFLCGVTYFQAPDSDKSNRLFKLVKENIDAHDRPEIKKGFLV